MRGSYGSGLEAVLISAAHVPLAGTHSYGYGLVQGSLGNVPKWVPKQKKLGVFFLSFSFFYFVGFFVCFVLFFGCVGSLLLHEGK